MIQANISRIKPLFIILNDHSNESSRILITNECPNPQQRAKNGQKPYK